MKNIIIALVLLITLASCQQQQKIGFIDNSEVVNKYQMKIELEDKFKIQDEAFKKRMDSVSRDFQIEVQAFQLAAQKMSQSKAQEKSQELGQKQQILQQQYQLEQQQMQQAFNTEIDSVLIKVKDFVSEYGKTNGYTFILGKNEAGSVMYGEATNDITEIIIEAINASHKEQK
ncbi:OmpH family outer membrane protein [Winogradskyella immobilis]|uniref:OmpH family outer membrane protein n=1 Tax=Winogradskyella immobilis TaxID=2816852 RepID=A0ABS8EJT3_9FLAO|nr:OmpH family outer membrane protein [Winogradskyella immobilis]MCC1483459.1 OmpH family outer membrane protein [Winogradskyella immobilis]MCG0015553.1 OmpH family outer membrane protein [Winogradskyella immobilis]